MAIRGSPLVPSTVSQTLICVDGTDNFEMSGTLFNPYMPKPVKFSTTYEIISAMERFFDKIAFPQPLCKDRSFVPGAKPVNTRRKEIEVHRYMSDDVFTNEQGKKATFVVQVQFRQNATWQGTITWTDEKKTQRFRSTLEMIKLMDSALVGGIGEDCVSNDDW